MSHLRFMVIVALYAALLSTEAQAQDFASDVKGFNTEPYSSTASLWQDYDNSNFNIVIGYVNKSWICTYEQQGTQREDFFGDSDAKFFHGIQIGGLYTPSLGYGFGLRTGLFLEAYTSRSKWITPICHRFVEGDMYIPLHVSYVIPFQDDVGLTFYGGIGFQWAMQGRYERYVGTVWPGGWWWRRPIPIVQSAKHEYGNGWPEKVNWQAELGAHFRFQFIGVNFSYSFGLKDHKIENTFDDGKTYVTSVKSRQDKMQASLILFF